MYRVQPVFFVAAVADSAEEASKASSTHARPLTLLLLLRPLLTAISTSAPPLPRRVLAAAPSFAPPAPPFLALAAALRSSLSTVYTSMTMTPAM